MPRPDTQVNGSGQPLKVSEVAELLGLTPAAIREQIDRGELCAIKIGKSWRCFLNFDQLREEAKAQTDTRRQRHERAEVERREREQAERERFAASREGQLATLKERIATLEHDLERHTADRDRYLAEERAIDAKCDEMGTDRPDLLGRRSDGREAARQLVLGELSKARRALERLEAEPETKPVVAALETEGVGGVLASVNDALETAHEPPDAGGPTLPPPPPRPPVE